jgi:hypothetical protein
MSAGIVVLGMHRSGTSLIGEALHRWGAFGRAKECLPSDQWNARGYWELSPLVNFNERLLRETGATWNFPPNQRDDSRLVELARQPAYKEEALNLLASMKTESPGSWFWKDPRLSLLLPFWQKIWGDVRYIICVRDPLEICRSLQKRDGLSFPVSILLWQRYMLSILEWTRNAPTLAIKYSSMLQHPASECARLSRFLQGSDSLPSSVGATGEMIKAVDRELRHFKSEETPASAILTNSQKELQEVLETMAHCGPASTDLNLERCSLPRVWRSSLLTNLLLLRCWRRWNRLRPNFSTAWHSLAPKDESLFSLDRPVHTPESETASAVSSTLNREDYLRLAIQDWVRW